jgi:hypothetical protein
LVVALSSPPVAEFYTYSDAAREWQATRQEIPVIVRERWSSSEDRGYRGGGS